MPRRSASPGTVAVSWPSMRIVPEVGGIRRLIIRSRVDLPLPEVPTRTVMVPGSTRRLTPLSAGTPS